MAIAQSWHHYRPGGIFPLGKPITRRPANHALQPLVVQSPAPSEQRSATSLASPLLASSMIHLAAAAALSLHAPYPQVADSAATLQVTLVQGQAPQAATDFAEPTPVQAPPRIAANPTRQATAGAGRSARFLDDPDLTILEQIPVPTHGSISLRLQVNAQGVVESVVVARSDPAPQALVDGLKQRFGAARLSPAVIDGAPAASSIEVTVRFEPGLHTLDPDRN